MRRHLGTRIDLWRVRLEPPPEGLQALFRILSSDEQERARRFATEVLSARFVVGRAALRMLLGAHVERDPASLRFDYGPAGKPSLRDDAVSFNVSHSGNLAVYALAGVADFDLGIDVEENRPLDDMHSVARRFFTPTEASTLAALQDHLQSEAFFTCWTRKEAYLKARGDGIGAPLDRFEVTIRSAQPPALVHIDGDPLAAADWHVHHLVPADNYIAALVHRGNAAVSAMREFTILNAWRRAGAWR